MKNNPDQEAKFSIGCRVTKAQKEILLQECKENGYQSFSQYLEDLILSTFEDFEGKQQTIKLSKEDIEVITEKISNKLKPKEITDLKKYTLDFEATVDSIFEEIRPKAAIGFLSDLDYSSYTKDDAFKDLITFINKELKENENLHSIVRNSIKLMN